MAVVVSAISALTQNSTTERKADNALNSKELGQLC